MCGRQSLAVNVKAFFIYSFCAFETDDSILLQNIKRFALEVC